MKPMSQTVAELDAVGRNPGPGGEEVHRRRVYRRAQHAGQITHYEQCEPSDGPDCLFAAIIVTNTGAQVRLPIFRNTGSTLAAEIVRKLR